MSTRHTSRLCLLVALVAMLVSVSCADNPERQWAGTIQQLPNGAVLVSNPDSGLWRAEEAWSLVEDLRIGKAEGDGPEVFGAIVAFGVSPVNDIYVIDASQEVRQFRSTGEFVRIIGRRGKGPGEFTRAYGIAWDAGGNTWVVDPALHRYTIFDSTGALMRDQSMPVQGYGPIWYGAFDGDSHLYDHILSFATDRMRFIGVRVGQDGRVDTLPELSYEAELLAAFPPPLPLIRKIAFTFDTAGNIWIAHTDRYRLVNKTLAGDTLRIVERRLEPARVTDAEKDSVITKRANGPVQIRAADFPTTRPAFDYVHLTGDGYLVVSNASPSLVREISPELFTFDVFDAEGRFLGTLKSPERLATFPPPQVHGNHIYGVATDSLDVQYIVRYRIARPGPAPS